MDEACRDTKGTSVPRSPVQPAWITASLGSESAGKAELIAFPVLGQNGGSGAQPGLRSVTIISAFSGLTRSSCLKEKVKAGIDLPKTTLVPVPVQTNVCVSICQP